MLDLSGGKGFGFYQIQRRGRIILPWTKFKNLITLQGRTFMLECMFNGETVVDPWYAGLISNSPSPVLSVNDTLASHAGWTEFTDYTGNRQTWTTNAASAAAITTATVFTFPIIDSGSIAGMFLASAATGTTGTLWNAATFPTATPVLNGDDVKLTYAYEIN